MLTFLLPSISSARVTSQLVRRLQTLGVQQEQQSNRHASTSTFFQQATHAARTDEDAEDTHDRARPSHPITEEFSHFFDKRTPLPSPSASPSTIEKSKASYEIAAASRHAATTFRQAIGSRNPAEIIAAYASLVKAQQRHVDHVTSSSSCALQPSDIGFPVRKADIQSAISHLLQHAQREGHMEIRIVKACHQMFEDLNRTFGFRVGPTDLHRHLQTFCLAKSDRHDPCDIFRQLRASYPDWHTTSVEWNMVISYLVKRKSFGHAIKVWHEMLNYGVTPEVSLRNTMIRLHLALNNTAEAEAHLQHLWQEQDQLGIDTLTITVQGLCRLAIEGKGEGEDTMIKLRIYARDLRKAAESSPQMDPAAWRALLCYEAIVAGPAQALRTARQAYQPGLFNHNTLCMLLRLHVDDLNDLQSSDEALELLDRVQMAIDPQRYIKPDDRCYNILMLGLLDNLVTESAFKTDDAAAFEDEVDLLSEASANRQSRQLPTPNQIREAQLLYDHVRSLGVPPTPLLVTPLMTAYCGAFLPYLPSAMKLFSDLLAYRSSSRQSSNRRKSSPAFSIDMKIIQPVLDACVRLKDISSALDLLSRLDDAGVFISAQHKSQLMRRLIGITASWPEAFHIYRSLSRFPTSWSSLGSTSCKASDRGLDEKGYISLLECLRTLTFHEPKLPHATKSIIPAPPEQLLSIVLDMRESGYKPSPSTYTSILDYYSKIPEPSYLGIKATHEMLKQDASLEPDLALINALMNAYNRAGEPAMVLAIWDSLLVARQEIDGVTLSVFFDTAGRHGLLSLARKAIQTVRRLEGEQQVKRKSVMTKEAWDSWLECLARCGRLEEAIELAFGEMRTTLFRESLALHDLDAADCSVTQLVARSTQAPIKNKRGQHVGPDAKTFGTLLKFGARERDRRQKRIGGNVKTWSTASNSAGGGSIWHLLRQRIREEFSWLYPQVKNVGQETL
ncbi:uncharacterized protein MEPE_02814 [Melanopsichium pennsylvanicum]|uniref:Uncharacterized protein n=2 Tax=Melanopsichium pennsylvanicum TaxID=63383 RepID=A0AAJ5C4V5_9BASI|nr:conserved hypothetical protein [Melanopsichium pennsylvanicum 4]SNX84106.1 uncharacterized protein MEPE_02814 [Melanopsichium pennsylvanicum]